MAADANPHFWSLSVEDQRDAIQAVAGAEDLDREPTALEKDLWVCWVLMELFACPGLPQMAFKGGTSLSKAFDAIDRFSEDVDITMDCRELIPEVDPFDAALSRKRRDADSKELIAAVGRVATDVVLPHLRDRLRAVTDGNGEVTVEQGGTELHVAYPSVLTERHGYYLEHVKVEFGGRNMTEPHQRHTLTPYLRQAYGGRFSFPTAQVDVLAPQRTFWEKFTLAHAESNKPVFRGDAGRLSRHWYDLAMLYQGDIGKSALEDLDLLSDVVKVKKRFYNSATAQYDLCLQGQARLLPDEAGLAGLREDYTKMLEAAMIRQPMEFDDVVAQVRALESDANSRTLP